MSATTIVMQRKPAPATPSARRYSWMAGKCYHQLEAIMRENDRIYPIVIVVADIAQMHLNAYCDLMGKAGNPVSDARREVFEDRIWGDQREYNKAMFKGIRHKRKTPYNGNGNNGMNWW